MSAPGTNVSPIEGVVIRRNPRNGFVVFQLHYDADPAKRGSAEMATLRAAMPRAQFDQEFEINWDSFSGMPVYQDFSPARHILRERPEPWPGLPLLRGWDFGLTPACVVAQLQGPQLVVFAEFTSFNKGAEQFCEEQLPRVHQRFSGFDWFDFADPAGVAKSQSDMTSCFEVLGKFGITPIPGPVSPTKRIQAVEHFLVRKTKEGEAFGIWEPDCPVLVRGFKGGYRYPEKVREIEPEKLRPVKDAHSHPHDALQYVAAGVRQGGLNTRGAQIPTLSYFKGASS
jgi:hypothetical protein